MSDVDWEAEDFEPPARVAVATDRWQGEDEEADVKDNWDEEEDEEQAKPTENGEAGGAVQTKKKRSLKEIIAEKEEKKRKELEEKKKLEEEVKPLSAAELIAEKLRQQKLQEESDLILAAEAFGVAPVDPIAARGIIDGMEPTSKEDFEKFEEVLREKITKFEKSTHYVPFLENLYRQLAIDLDPEDIKRLGSTLTALSNEKNKQQKGPKGKKKKQKATINVGKDTDDALAVETGGYDDYDDFI